eukprot:scaffold9899_cov122-Isochrysis_galbana.AAC.3
MAPRQLFTQPMEDDNDPEPGSKRHPLLLPQLRLSTTNLFGGSTRPWMEQFVAFKWSSPKNLEFLTRAANSSAVLNNGVISASWPSTGVENGSRGSRPKSIVSGLAYWSLGTVSGCDTPRPTLKGSICSSTKLFPPQTGYHHSLYQSIPPE